MEAGRSGDWFAEDQTRSVGIRPYPLLSRLRRRFSFFAVLCFGICFSEVVSEAIRLQKYIARSGFASRRRAEDLIVSGRVLVNGAVVSELGVKVNRGDKVEVDGRRLRPLVRNVYLAIYKPRGVVCSAVSSEKFPSFLTLLPDALRRGVHHAGRLDVSSEGLLLASNDGEFTYFVTHPKFGVRKEYEVETRGCFLRNFREQSCRGIRVDGEWLRFADLQIVRDDSKQGRVIVNLIGGKNREIRRLLQCFGLQVTRLKRIRIGSVELKGLRSGSWRHLRPLEFQQFLRRVKV